MQPIRWLMILCAVVIGWSTALPWTHADVSVLDHDHVYDPAHPFPVLSEGPGGPVAIVEPRGWRGDRDPEEEDRSALSSTLVLHVLSWGLSSHDCIDRYIASDGSHGRWTRAPPVACV